MFVKAVGFQSPNLCFVSFICSCYMLLCIRLSFGGRFSVVPNHTIFASKEDKSLSFSFSSKDYIRGNVIFTA